MRLAPLVTCLASLFFACPPPPEASPPRPALDAFVADRAGFAYAEAWATHAGGVSTAMLSMTSQTWRSLEEVDRTEWKHSVGISWLDGAPMRTALVVVAGGSGVDDPPAAGADEVKGLEALALTAGTPVIIVSGIPSNPLSISGLGTALTEDDLVAPTWDRVLVTGDPTWSAYFPMTRSVVRAMDAVQEYMRLKGHSVDRFVVTGFSKRGATTWLTAAVDPRVVGIAPGVFDFLNFRPQAAHHLAVYGTPAAAVKAYADLSLLDRVATPEADMLVHTSDPWVYRDRFTMPKLILASPGDQFFLPDAMKFYLQDLPGETQVRYVANTDHTLADPAGSTADGLRTITSWYRALAGGKRRPAVTWVQEGDTLTVTADQPLQSAKLWKATNPAGRDFRREIIGAAFVAEPLMVDLANQAVATVGEPPSGASCYFIEVNVDGVAYSTQAYVTPGS